MKLSGLTQEQANALRGEERERYIAEGLQPRPRPLEPRPTVAPVPTGKGHPTVRCSRCDRTLNTPHKGEKAICPVCDSKFCACGKKMIRRDQDSYFCPICQKPHISDTCNKCGGPMKWDMTEGNVDSYVCERGCDGVLDIHHVQKSEPIPELKKESGYRALNDVLQERARQDAKWGEQNHDPLVYGAILTEEVGEFFQAALDTRFGGKDGGTDKVRNKAVQVAAVALAIVECLDRGKWNWGATTKTPDVQKDS